jgi:D-sedoheptulose 7-phosphate isomerase
VAYFEDYIESVKSAISSIDINRVEAFRELLVSARAQGNTIFTCGNGGSAATASHFATDLGKGASHGKSSRFRVVALTDSMSTVSAYSNDVDYSVVFEEQLANLLTPGDIVVAVSGSGNSPNVIKALEFANAHGGQSVAFTGRDGGGLGQVAQLHINVREQHMGRIEDAHMALCHMIAFSFIDAE